MIRYKAILDRIMRDLKPPQRVKAYRMLKWLACSFRLLKIYEVQDGIVFHTDNDTLDDSSKLPADIINHCKPIIEEGAGRTVDFVHYSAKEYASTLDRY